MCLTLRACLSGPATFHRLSVGRPGLYLDGREGSGGLRILGSAFPPRVPGEPATRVAVQNAALLSLWTCPSGIRYISDRAPSGLQRPPSLSPRAFSRSSSSRASLLFVSKLHSVSA